MIKKVTKIRDQEARFRKRKPAMSAANTVAPRRNVPRSCDCSEDDTRVEEDMFAAFAEAEEARRVRLLDHDEPPPSFVPTHEELLALAKHWAMTVLGQEINPICRGELALDQVSMIGLAGERIRLIAEVLGKDAYRMTLEETNEGDREDVVDEN